MVKLSVVGLFLLTSFILLSNQVQGQFNSSNYSTSVYENITVGTRLDLGISAIGHDGVPVTYSITSEGITDFIINGTTGVISTAQSLDYEVQEVYQFSIGATDLGSNQGSSGTSVANVTITVLDVNDNPPMFNSTKYSVTVPEDTRIGTTILSMSVKDADTNSDEISLSITSGNDEGKFRLGSELGTLTIASSLDRETTASYNLTVQATDGGSPSLSSSTSVVIIVSDVNDNAPVFTQSTYTSTLPFDALNEWSTTVTATDRDSGTNAAIIYSIIDGDVAKIFSINPESGQIKISTTGTFDPEEHSKFTLTVQATDRENSDQATVVITVDTGTGTSTSTSATIYGTTDTSDLEECSTAFTARHSLKLFLYPLLPSLVLLLSAVL